MDLAEFRRCCPYLVHYAPQIDLALGLLPAAQVLDRNADEHGNLWARFRNENTFRPIPWTIGKRIPGSSGERVRLAVASSCETRKTSRESTSSGTTFR